MAKDCAHESDKDWRSSRINLKKRFPTRWPWIRRRCAVKAFYTLSNRFRLRWWELIDWISRQRSRISASFLLGLVCRVWSTPPRCDGPINLLRCANTRFFLVFLIQRCFYHTPQGSPISRWKFRHSDSLPRVHSRVPARW